MSYDHVLLPAGAATSADAVEAYLAGQQGQAETEIVAAVAAELNRRNEELPEQDAFLSVTVGGEGTGAALYVASPYDAIGHVRALLFELATPRDYALYDPQLNWLIDPTGRIDVTVTHGGAGEFPYLTEKLVRQWVPELAEPNPYLIVERADQTYIQTYRDEPGRYMLEFRDGGPDRHFGTQLEDGDRVAELIWEWTAGDTARLDALGWEPVSF
ncbi:hypothetical protein NONO_c02980 [Nocardia nova SH22a]|uniref:Uncharacterized protein n=1 Tax=Nocardia nova SH22a TaxID=1415166 RepID=W5T813_9NOCA|nr:hypothetical protein [Nocardia nova]AHH15113.1 hypothetical protein NONO_c02980 [Nocardia nova SH22a]